MGEGGQAVVLRVTDRRLQAERALKVLTPAVASNLKARARFVDEARAMAALDHPNIVRIFDVDTDEVLPFIVMEYLPGGSLLGWLERYRVFPPRQAVTIAMQVCAGAAAAHAVGIIHRDLKPHNVLVAADGTCRVTDFGIARTGQGARTMTGAAMGTLGYMAPEQSRDATNVDPRSDVFSIGMTLVVLLTGGDPFQWTAGELSHAVHPLLLPALTRATAPRPDRRHTTAEELAASLAAVAERLPPDPARVPLAALPRVDDPDLDLEDLAILLDGHRPSLDPAPASRRTPPGPTPEGRAEPTWQHGNTPASLEPGRTRRTPPEPGPEPSWIETPAAVQRGFVVGLDDKEREQSRLAREKRASTSRGGSGPRTPGPPPDPLLSELGPGPIAELNTFVYRMSAAIVGGALTFGFIPLGLAIGLGLLLWLGKTSWDERSAGEALLASRSALEETIDEQRDVLDVLARAGAHGNELLALYTSWEVSRGEEERTRAALLLVDAIEREAERLGVTEDEVRDLVEARDEYRQAAAAVESFED